MTDEEMFKIIELLFKEFRNRHMLYDQYSIEEPDGVTWKFKVSCIPYKKKKGGSK